MTTPSLIEWLREQLDTDERLARDLDGACWHIDICGESGHNFFDALDADQLLAEVQSKRAILDVHPIETDLSEYERGLGTGQSFGCRRCADDDGVIKGEGYCRTLQALAEPYRSRPGFRKEWLDG